ncbi:MAG: hypothetical protein DRP63_04805 [Planctomycetota bacterium]|nr:MAG: hypothetical protein DRP63_04805 [Planctomycetota bacterium]
MLEKRSVVRNRMTKEEAVAEVFWRAFKALGRKEQQPVLMRIAKDARLRQGLMDIAVAMERISEPVRSLKDVLAEMKKKMLLNVS